MFAVFAVGAAIWYGGAGEKIRTHPNLTAESTSATTTKTSAEAETALESEPEDELITTVKKPHGQTEVAANADTEEDT